MARARKNNSKPARVKKPMDPELARKIRRALFHTTAAIFFVAALGVGLWVDRGYVEHRIVFAKEPPKVVLKNRPVWMSDFLAEQITKVAKPAGTHSAFDHQLLVDTVALLNANPWIREVKQVRRVYGQQPGDTLEVDCEYRAPVALVHWKDYYWLVDGEGVKLPEAFNAGDVDRIIRGADQKINIRVVAGVQLPPPESGARWAGDDLQAGLELVKLLFGRPYTEEIVKVDVTNYANRQSSKAAQLVLVTKYGTQVRWGQPVTPKEDSFFIEAAPQQKLAYLEAIYNDKGRVDAHFQWVDVRFDWPTIPSSAQTAQAQMQQPAQQ